VAAAVDEAGQLRFLAPHGLEDLFALRLRPTPRYRDRPDDFHARIEAKGWLRRWPKLSLGWK
jgi:hypothetical protein